MKFEGRSESTKPSMTQLAETKIDNTSIGINLDEISKGASFELSETVRELIISKNQQVQ